MRFDLSSEVADKVKSCEMGVPHKVYARVVVDVRILHWVAKSVASKVDLRLI